MVKLSAEMENNHSRGSTRIVRDEGDVSFVDQYLLECGDEELSEIQTLTYKKTGEVLEFANALSSLQVTNCNVQTPQGPRPIVRSTTPGVIASTASPTSQQVYIPSQNGLQNGGYVVVDNNMKFVVTPTTASSVRPATRVIPATATPRAYPPRPRAPLVNSVARPTRPTLQLPLSATPRLNIIAKPKQVPPVASTASVSPAWKPIDDGPVVDLTDDDNRTIVEPDEVPQIVPGTVGGKRDAQEKTYPSLVVTARTNLCNKLYSQAVMNTERQLLDNRLKRTLQMQTGMFTEHLLQQRLIKCDQVCSEHPNVKLKLGMYSDAQKFPFSGGYVWIADCCPSSFTSVFRGSIFEIGPHPPTTILKLLYHWACQTSVANVLQWVKVDTSFLKTFYMYLRAVCIAAVHEKWELMGGPGSGSKRIEVGVISLGTSTSSGGVREVKVDILGAMDYENKRLRLKALDHLNVNETTGRANEIYLKKFQRILEVLSKWVHPRATIVTDFAIDKNLCNVFGFVNMTQSTEPKFSNGHVMDYLRFVVPRMFQNTLNLLSRSIIQQFLDELVWRETWGHIPSKAYDSIIEHLAEQTKLDGPEDISVRYTLIASNPNKNWKYAMWPTNMSQASVVTKKGGVTGVKTVHRVVKTTKGPTVVIPKKTAPVSIQLPTTPTSTPQPAAPSTAADGNYPELAKIALEPYYYGTIQGDPSRQKPTGLFGAFLTECILCSKDLFSSSAFTNHLVHHALNSSSAIQEDQPNSLRLICRFCMKPVVNLENHVKEFHKHSHLVKKTMCKICNTIHRDEAALVSHMIYTHVELDMPYFCEICSYRTSVYQDMLVHFEKCHNKDTCVQCPFCLKIVRFAARNGEDIPNNQMYFIQHIQKHTIARQVRKCEKCALSFTNLSTLKNHQEFFHSSCVDYENVERYDLNPNDFILMSAPLVDPPPPMSLADNENFTLKGVPLAPSIKVSDDLKIFLCAECDGPITPRHFCVRMTCTKCRFQTCCANAVKDHNALAHSASPLASGILPIRHFIGGRPIMAKALYCSACLFTTNNGNRLAAHLASHSDDVKARAVSDKRKASSLMIEPAVSETPEPPATETPEPPVTEAPGPPISETLEPPVTATPEPPVTETSEPPVTETPEPPVAETPEPEESQRMDVDEESVDDPPAKRRKSSSSSASE